MKAISLWQPWASLIACGVKVYETRSWPPPRELIGQPIAIHAAKKIDRGAAEFAEELMYGQHRPGGFDLADKLEASMRRTPDSLMGCFGHACMPIGCVVCIARLAADRGARFDAGRSGARPAGHLRSAAGLADGDGEMTGGPKQSRAMSLAESLINIGVGLGVAMAANAVILPLVGLPLSIGQNVLIAIPMTAVSIVRSYMLRRLFEALHIRTPLSPAMLAVIAERRRQIEVEGWTPEHDDRHEMGELASAGGCYAACAGVNADDNERPPADWPWRSKWWKPQNFRRDLVRAGALIIAEIEKFDRARKRGGR